MCPFKPKTIMYPKKIPTCYQPQLLLPGKTLWHQFPEATRVRCRQLLVQLLQQAARITGTERSVHEQQDPT
jgi:hypothetical protein